MKNDPFRLRFDGGIWMGETYSGFGRLAVILKGTKLEPHPEPLAALVRFHENLDENIRELRRKFSFGFFWSPYCLGVNDENLVAVMFRNWLFASQVESVFESKPVKSLRPVPGATTFTFDGEVIYNSLTPHMQKFMGRCIGAIKKSGIAARGTGQFSIVIGDLQQELPLDDFYEPNDDPAAIARVVAEAQSLTASK